MDFSIAPLSHSALAFQPVTSGIFSALSSPIKCQHQLDFFFFFLLFPPPFCLLSPLASLLCKYFSFLASCHLSRRSLGGSWGIIGSNDVPYLRIL